ncbi:hypothetical protein [Cyanothece sp. BG0011]|uniref:hypothetical protein n=1 Tax=Cyanothece sp. BG0011 TaxID=2082950 RepID=UPI000D1FA24E|nr:hypothetical protein [Cyanothece sp. BG0011]
MTINIVSQLTNFVKKHSNFIQPIATVSLLTTSFFTINSQSASAVILALHEGANNPVDQGWTVSRSFNSRVSKEIIISRVGIAHLTILKCYN